MPFKRKSISIHWELMFTRSLFQTADIQAQHALLNEVSRLVDAGALRTTLGETLGKINAANLKKAHALLEAGRAKGKLVLKASGTSLDGRLRSRSPAITHCRYVWQTIHAGHAASSPPPRPQPALAELARPFDP